MDNRKLRDLWHETQTARDHSRQSRETVEGLERAALLAQEAEALSDGVGKLTALMHKGLEEMRSRMDAAVAELAAARVLILRSVLEHQNQ